MELLLLLLLPALFSGVFGSGGDDDTTPEEEPDGQVWRGTSGQDLQDGTDVSDLMLGGAGPDDLSGDSGHDLLVGQTGQDTLYGGAGDDLMLGGWGQDSLLGGDGSDIMMGGAMADSLFGGAGSDRLFGSSGADLLQGDAGNDYLVGLDVRDDVSIEDIAGNVVITNVAALETNLRGFFGSEMTASDVEQVHQNILNADPSDQAADTLLGGAGNDILEGDNGDSLAGGDGVDVFAVYNEVGDDAVTVTDFNPATERLLIWSEARINGTDLIDTLDGLEVRVNDRVVAVLQGVTNAMLTDPNAIRFETEFNLKTA